MKKGLLILLCLPFIRFVQTVFQAINYQYFVRDASCDILICQALTIKK